MVSLVYPEHLLRGRREHQVLLAALLCQGCEQHCEGAGNVLGVAQGTCGCPAWALIAGTALSCCQGQVQDPSLLEGTSRKLHLNLSELEAETKAG